MINHKFVIYSPPPFSCITIYYVQLFPQSLFTTFNVVLCDCNMALWYAWNPVSERITDPIDINRPNVPTEPIIYCPSVLMTPFGPAPFCKMENPPNKTPTQTPTVDPISAPILNLSKLEGWCWAYWYCWTGGIVRRNGAKSLGFTPKIRRYAHAPVLQ